MSDQSNTPTAGARRIRVTRRRPRRETYHDTTLTAHDIFGSIERETS